MNVSEFFQSSLGQTTPFPFLIHVKSAKGLFIYDQNNNAIADLISGVAVSSLGHGHPKIQDAIHKQVDEFMHVMVYGEFIQDAQVTFANALLKLLPETLNAVYPVNSGTEAIEAAMKLVKRVTGRSEIIAFKGAYHGSTQGSMSISSNEVKKTNFRPLLPGIRFINLNRFDELDCITENKGGVFLETIQGDAGIRIPEVAYIQALRKRCDEVGAMLVLDEIQCGLGRTGKLFAFEHFGIVPDVLTLGKALGGGMPIGALVTRQEWMQAFTHDPMLGHITTFGGHPIVCAAATAFLDVLTTEIDLSHVLVVAEIFRETIGAHPDIVEVRNKGLMFAFDMVSAERVEKVVKLCLEKNMLTFWFLSHPNSFRLAPPLNITVEQANYYAGEIFKVIEETKD